MTEKKLSRRDAMKMLGVAVGAAALANLPSKWDKPEALSGVLPAHARQSAAVACLAAIGNVALGKATSHSSIESAGFESSKAVDGNTSAANSRWASENVLGKDPQWMYVDLGANYNINRVTIYWEAAFAVNYLVEVSTDAVNWNVVATVTGSTGGVMNHAFAATSCVGGTGGSRYVRVYCTQRTGANNGFSLFELEVYG